MAWPMPEPPPVTSATLVASEKSRSMEGASLNGPAPSFWEGIESGGGR